MNPTPTIAAPAVATATPAPPRPTATLVPTPRLVSTATPTAAARANSSASSAQPSVIDAGDYFFNPVVLTVPAGTMLTWRNVGGESHNVVARDGSFTSTSLMPGERFSYTFTKPGQYPYVCTFHEGDGMFAEIDVQ